MKTILTVLVTFFAGMGAGLGTGFAGMSAAAVFFCDSVCSADNSYIPVTCENFTYGKYNTG